MLEQAKRRQALRLVNIPGKKTPEELVLLTADPNEAMNVGLDAGSQVGPGKTSPSLKGRVDEVRIYHRALSEEELSQLADTKDGTPANDGLVLHLSFDDGSATDISGHGYDGGCGAKPCPGKRGNAMAFGKSTANPAPRGSRLFLHNWSLDCPIYARSLALARNALVIAGPRDVLDEEESYRRWYDKDMQEILHAQDDLMAGTKGALLILLNRETGEHIATCEIPAGPVWDGMAIDQGRILLPTVDGTVTCFAGNSQ